MRGSPPSSRGEVRMAQVDDATPPAAIGRAAVVTQPGVAPSPAAMPAMDNAMSSAGWLQDILIKLEREATEDITMLPEILKLA